MKERESITSRIIFFLIMLFILFGLVTLAISIFSVVIEMNINTTIPLVLTSITDTFLHPIEYIKEVIDNKFLLIIYGIITLCTLYSFTKSSIKNRKEGWETDNTQTHGSAKWNTAKGVVSKGDYHTMNYRKFYSEWKKTLMGEGDKQ